MNIAWNLSSPAKQLIWVNNWSTRSIEMTLVDSIDRFNSAEKWSISSINPLHSSLHSTSVAYYSLLAADHGLECNRNMSSYIWSRPTTDCRCSSKVITDVFKNYWQHCFLKAKKHCTTAKKKLILSPHHRLIWLHVCSADSINQLDLSQPCWPDSTSAPSIESADQLDQIQGLLMN